MSALITFRHVFCRKGSGDHSVPVLKDLSFTIQEGEIVTILGPSGSGKSTLLRLIIHLDFLESGDIFYRGKSTKEWNVVELRREIGFVLQTPYMFEGSVRDNILYGPRIHRRMPEDEDGFVQNIMNSVGLTEDLAGRKATELSVGQKMRVSFARTLANQSQVLLLDEPTASLDPIAANRIHDLIQQFNHERNLTILVVTHEIQTARKLGKRSLFLMEGRIVEEGTIDDLIENASPEVIDFLEGNME